MKRFLSLLVLLWSADLLADLPGARPSGYPQGLYVPNAGNVRSNKVREMRARALFANGPGAGAAGLQKVTSPHRRLPVVPVSFSNAPGLVTPEQLNERVFGLGPDANGAPKRSVAQYFKDVSNDHLLLEGLVLPWFQLTKPDAYYENRGGNGGGPPLGELLHDGLVNAEATIDFGQFDNDGPDGVPNSGDDDGIVDAVLFFHSKAGAENQVPATEGNIWSHCGHYGDPVFGHAGPYVTKALQRSKDGTVRVDANGQPAHITVDDYTIQGSLGYNTQTGALGIVEIGVICHEFMHTTGLPDLYDRTNTSNGIGAWCLMGFGMYGGDGQSHPDCPAHLSAWCKLYLGWGRVQRIASTTQILLEPTEQSGQIYRVDVPETGGKEYFLMEYRDPTWSFPGRVNWDQYLPASGLAVWHVDETVGSFSPNWPMVALKYDADNNLLKQRAQNDDLNHPLVGLLQADKRRDLEALRNRGDSDDVWLTGAEFGPDPIAGAKDYKGHDTGIRLRDINTADGSATIVISSPAAPTAMVAAAAPAAAPAAAAGPRLAAAPPAAVAGPPVPPSVPAAESKVLIGDFDKSYVQGAAKDFIRMNKEKFKKLSKTAIESAARPESRAILRNESAKLRTSVVNVETAAVTKTEQIVKQVFKDTLETSPVKVQNDATGTVPEHLANLNLPVNSANLMDDAKSLISTKLKTLFGERDLVLSPKDTYLKQVTFQHRVGVAGEKLPVFGCTVVFHYDPGGAKLLSIDSNNLPAGGVTVTGSNKLDAAKALKIAGDVTGSATLKADDAALGVYLDHGKDNASGRVAWRVRVPAGDYIKPIEAFVDAETGKVLAVE